MPSQTTNTKTGVETTSLNNHELNCMQVALACCKWLAVHAKDDEAVKAAPMLGVIAERYQPKKKTKPAAATAPAGKP